MAQERTNGGAGVDEAGGAGVDEAGGARRPRADARRNRQRVIEVAGEVFRTEGLSVPVHEIARRAGVGTGTVSRHFPTKEALFEAVFLSRVDQIVRMGQLLACSDDPGEAFFTYLAEVIAEATAHKGLAEALAGAGFDLGALKCDGQQNILGRLQDLLVRAQRCGAIRCDVDVDDVWALMAGCLSRDACARDRMVSIARAGLRPRAPLPGEHPHEQRPAIPDGSVKVESL